MDNALKSNEDSRDWIFERLVHGPRGYYNELPEQFSLEEYSAPVRHQGARGTCGPFAATKIGEINLHRKTVLSAPSVVGALSTPNHTIPAQASTMWTYLSPEFIYFHRANKPAAGMYGRDVFQVLKKYGTVLEEHYPYTADDNQSPQPGRELYKLAEDYKINGFARVKTIEGLKRAIIELGACYIGLPMFNRTERFWDRAHGAELNIGHAVTAVGYNNEGFIIENSWGLDWGRHGRTIFPYRDFDLHWEIWVPVTSG